MTDVVDLIIAQHRELDALLSQAEQAEPQQVRQPLETVAGMLKPHSEAEESFVYPAIEQYAREESDEVKDGTAEHHHVDALLDELLAKDPDEPGYDGLVAAMVGEIRHHVQEEETELLPVLSDRASPQEREELGVRFTEVTGYDLPANGGRSRSPSVPSTSSLADLTRDELYQQAKERDLPGRASMTKDELVQALQDG